MLFTYFYVGARLSISDFRLPSDRRTIDLEWSVKILSRDLNMFLLCIYLHPGFRWNTNTRIWGGKHEWMRSIGEFMIMMDLKDIDITNNAHKKEVDFIKLGGKWAATWQNQQNECAPIEDSDQHGHPPSLIRVFAVRSVDIYGPNLSSCRQRRLGGCRGWSESSLGAQSFCWFCHVAAQIYVQHCFNECWTHWQNVLAFDNLQKVDKCSASAINDKILKNRTCIKIFII